jgi:hypothetical protein
MFDQNRLLLLPHLLLQVWLNKQLDEQLQSLFSSNFITLFEAFEGVVPPFVNFMRGVRGPPLFCSVSFEGHTSCSLKNSKAWCPPL